MTPEEAEVFRTYVSKPVFDPSGKSYNSYTNWDEWLAAQVNWKKRYDDIYNQMSFNQIQQLMAEFKDVIKGPKGTEGKVGGIGDYDGVHGLQCVDLSAWYIDTKTSLTYGAGNGIDVVPNLIKANKDELEKESSYALPRVGSIFSSKTNYGASGRREGHTGIVVAVRGNMVTIIDTSNMLWGNGKIVQTNTYEWHPNDGSKFVYVGKYLN